MRRPMDGVLSVRVILYIRMEASFYCRLAGAVLNTKYVYRYPTWSTF